MMENVVIYSVGLVFCSVCTDLKDTAEIERRVNNRNPSGTHSGWKIAKEDFRTGESNPCRCNKDKGRWHYLLSC